MPINFACPRCSRRLAIATRKAGAEVPCPACGQRIIVPTPPPDKPLPGILIEPAPVVSSPSAHSPETDAPTLMDEPYRDERRDPEPEPEEDYEPIRRRKKNRNPAIIGVSILAIITFIMIVGAFVRSDRRSHANAPAKQPSSQARNESGRGPGYGQAEYRDREETPTPSIFELFTGSIMGFLCLFFCLAFYFTPTIIAVVRKHNNIAPILVVNFFLGWAFVGWVIAMTWAFTDLKHLENQKRSWL